MKDRLLGLLTTILLFSLPGMVFAAGEWSWATTRILEHPGWTWVFSIVVLIIVGILLGIEKRGAWDGLIIDATNRKSLSRVQALFWGMIMLSGVVSAITINVARDCRIPNGDAAAADGSCVANPVDLHIPEQVLVLVAISATTLGLAVAANSSNASRVMRPNAVDASVKAGLLQIDPSGTTTSAIPPNQFYGVIAGKESVEQSSWSDVVKGDVASHAAYVDLARTQFLILSIVLAGIYAAHFLREIRVQSGAIQFPEFDAGLNIILAISATTYLGVKTILGISSSKT